MGLPDSYTLPASYNEGYHVMGDAVVVPVVSWLERHLLRPLAEVVEVQIEAQMDKNDVIRRTLYVREGFSSKHQSGQS